MISWLLALTVAATPASAPGPEHTISLAFLADRFGQVAPCHCDSQPLGGVDRQAGAIAEWRKKTPGLFVIDGGDNFFADAITIPTADESARAELIADSMADIKVDAAIPGEKDLAAGTDTFRELGIRSKVIWIISNLVSPADRLPRFLPQRALNAGDQKILVLGLWSAETLPAAIKAEGYKLEDPIAAAKRLIATYRNAVDIVVVVAHTTGQIEEKLAQEVPEISLILSAHEGRLQFGARTVEGCQIFSAAHDGKYLTRIDLHYRNRWPRLLAGTEVQKYYREVAKGHTDTSSPVATADAAFFQLYPLSADSPAIPALTERAKALDGEGYKKQ